MAALYFSSHDLTAGLLLRSRTLFRAPFLPREDNKKDDVETEDDVSSVAVEKCGQPMGQESSVPTTPPA